MRRPLALAGFSLLCAHLLGVVLGYSFVMALGTASLILLIILLFCKNSNRLMQSLRGCCFCFLCGCCCLVLAFTFQVKPLQSLSNTTRLVTFTVQEEQGNYDNRNYYVVLAEGFYPNQHKEANLRLSLPFTYPLEVGDTAQGLLSLTYGESPKLAADHIFITATLAQDAAPTVVVRNKTPNYIAHQIRNHMASVFNRQGSANTSALLKGVCLGNANGLSSKAQKGFYNCGLGHLVAVSGLHTNQVGSVFIGLFLLLIKGKRWVKLCSLVFVWGFVAITGFSFSALRAAIMFTFFAVGSCFFRKIDSLNTLGGAVTLITLCNPFAAGNIGFLASVSSCLGLILLATPLEQKLVALMPNAWQANSILLYAAKGIAATLAASVATVPCTFLAFHTFSLLSPLTNLLCVPLATGILILGLTGWVLSCIPPFSLLSALCLWIAHGMAAIILSISQGIGQFTLPLLTLGTPSSFAIFLLGGGSIGWILVKHRPSRSLLRRCLVVFLCCCIIGSAFLPAIGANRVEFCVLASPYETALAVVSRNDTIFIGTALSQELKEYLGSRGVGSIALWVLPKRNQYTATLTTLANQMPIQQIMTFPQAQNKGVLSPFETLPSISTNEKITVGNITVTAFNNQTAFLVSHGNTTFYFADTATTSSSGYSFSLLHRNATNGEQHLLVTKDQTLALSQTMVIQPTKTHYRLYEPRFLF